MLIGVYINMYARISVFSIYIRRGLSVACSDAKAIPEPQIAEQQYCSPAFYMYKDICNFVKMNIVKKVTILLFILIGICACKNDPPIDTISVNGALCGEFSVSETTKVHFSQGNLEYSAEVWSFAKNQWEWGDLFAWNHSKDSSFIDWGINPISNGGNQPNQWRTLTMDEWVYLFRVRTNAEYLFGFGKVNGTKGLIILPDNWDQVTSDVPDFSSGISNGMIWKKDSFLNYNGYIVQWGYYYNTKGSDIFSHNSYKGKEWHKMEIAGAVFLPAAGNWESQGIRQNDGKYGDYWTATKDKTAGNMTDSYCLDFNQQGLLPMCSGPWRYGFSVRLVSK